MRPYILSELHWSNVKDQEYELAILPWGACEAHNYHLPYGTDNYETEALVFEAARLAWEQGSKVVVLPTIPMGVNTGQSDIYMTLNMNPSTQQSILEDLAESLIGYGLDKLLVVNGHGGNDFRQILREVGAAFPDMFLATCNSTVSAPSGPWLVATTFVTGWYASPSCSSASSTRPAEYPSATPTLYAAVML